MSGATIGEQTDMVVDLLEPHFISLRTAVDILRSASGMSRTLCTHLLAGAYQARCRAAEQPTRHDDGSWTP